MLKNARVLTSNKRISATQWVRGFCAANILLFWVIGLHFIPSIPRPDWHLTLFSSQIVIKTFIFTAYLGYFSLFVLLPTLFLIVPACYLPWKRATKVFAVIVMSVASLLFIVDTYLYGLYHYHLHGYVLHMIFNHSALITFQFSGLEYFMIFGCITTIFFIQTFFVLCSTKLVRRLNKIIRWLFYLCVAFFLLSLFLYIYAGSKGFYVLTEESRFLPYYDYLISLILPQKHALAGIVRQGERNFTIRDQINAPLHYPKKSLNHSAVAHTYNIVVIMIDTWRFDMVNKSVTPKIASFSKKSWVFKQHFSGGDATQAGVFSFFYSLPVTYWTSMQLQHQGPVFIHELLKQHYKIGVFQSAPLTELSFDKTVFVEPHHLFLTTPGAGSYERDQKALERFKHFIQEQSKAHQKFFSFIFFDAVHAYDFPKDKPPIFKPFARVINRVALTNHSDPTPYLNRYKNALFYVDELVGQAIDQLKKYSLLSNTVVIITADHGEEFNDNHLGFWGHSSNFTRYQLQVPFILYWPGGSHHVVRRRTTHYDVVPTLLHEVLGIQNPSSDYSVGQGLFKMHQKHFFIANSYIDMGIVEPNRITVIYPSGAIEIDDVKGKPLSHASVETALLWQVNKEIRQFY